MSFIQRELPACKGGGIYDGKSDTTRTMSILSKSKIMAKEIITTKIAIFQKKEIRKTLKDGEWYFVIEDVVAALTDSKQSKGYIKDMRRRDPELAKGWG